MPCRRTVILGKVIVFSKSKSKSDVILTFNGEALETVEEFSYLGVKFNFNGKFLKTKKFLIEQARKAMFALLRKAKQMCLPVDIQLHLFDTLVLPILLYSSEVWGFEDLKMVESFHLKFCKMFLNVNNKTSSLMVYGELGRAPLHVLVHTRMLTFWFKTLHGKDEKISFILLKVMSELHKRGIFHSPRITHNSK